ncbi:hypothetical protein [uncultured Sphaerochaeta sp.]|uniref:hypothetical protein n=1 Tax=uncultured Sphaerochaeta sp. TaxID=886478 RepID=UPI0029C8F747|nr:hypothetical protein [uncultured Sphaerochaeta sp.]
MFTLGKIFLGIVVIKLTINVYRLIRIRILFNRYIAWLIKERKATIVKNKSEVIDLWKHAGISDSYIPRVDALGLGQVASYKQPLFHSFPSNLEDMATTTQKAFLEAIGVYKKRAIDSVNPIEWIILIVYLPQRFLASIGITKPKAVINISQGLYWLAGVFLTIVFALYPVEIRSAIESLLFK